MDIQPQTTQPISDDQELAKVLAGVSEVNDNVAAPLIETTAPLGPPPTAPTVDSSAEADISASDSDNTLVMPELPALAAAEESITQSGFEAPATSVPASSSELDGVKMDAIKELRPLVDKLNLAPEEKFDTYLLLIRSTDDKTLVAPAHEAAKSISDETRRAQALLDIIKEIDFLSGQQPQN